ncbi:hypothetical protein Ataiwa_04910 [Algoriphagus taiwanensis]|uniref:Secreted protein n=1 Tax=Algoriphagus taiwanensis TaxID=1445656 RepID=A0ABQ6PWA9_9BACT|nr:hypothetical protein Ataiwa_04910 [Algoriphagus taiwanensis]
MNSKQIKFRILALIFIAFSYAGFAQESLPGSSGGGCEVSMACSSNENDYVRCSGSACERDPLSRSVTCDGVTTSC